MEQETRGCVSRVTRVPGGKYPTPAIPGQIRNAIPRAQYGMQYQAHGSTGSTRVPHGSMVFQHSGGEILTIPETPTTQGLSLWCFNIAWGADVSPDPTAPTRERRTRGAWFFDSHPQHNLKKGTRTHASPFTTRGHTGAVNTCQSDGLGHPSVRSPTMSHTYTQVLVRSYIQSRNTDYHHTIACSRLAVSVQ